MRKSIIILIVLISGIIFISLFIKNGSYTAHPEHLTVVIDAGHGGIDGGAVGVNTLVKESEVNLAVSLKLKQYFENAGINVVLTRSSPMGLYGPLSGGFKRRDVEKRVEITRNANADVFISIHMNKFKDTTVRGAQVFYKNDEKSKILAKSIQLEMDKIDSDGKAGVNLSGDYYVLNNSPIPAVICECGFLSNPQDEKLLLSEDYQKDLAYSIFLGCCTYFYTQS